MKLRTIVMGNLLNSALLIASGHSGTHWGYTGHSSPSNWGELSEDYKMCKIGSSQSPINISYDNIVETSGLDKINFHYNADSSSVLNNGHSIQVNVNNGSSIHIDGINFELKQFHFHTPSENEIDGKHFPLEAHFVHAAKDGSLAVVAVLFHEGAKNSLLEKVWAKMPHEAGDKANISLSAKEINAFLPKDKNYYRFSGSLTTPPCSEGVRWFVLKSYDSISEPQVEQFLHVMHHPNNRPVQPINARKVI